MSKSKLCYPRKNKNGEIISYRFYYNGKEPMTGKPKQYTYTWKIPKGLSNKQIEVERRKAELEFIQESEKKSNGTYINETNITLGEFSKRWLKSILVRKEDSYAYYNSSEYALKIINEYFGDCLLKQINPVKVQEFYYYLSKRTYIKEIVTVKKSFLDLVDNAGLSKTKLAEACGMDRLTLRIASQIGNNVSMATAKSISKHFKIPVADLFDVEKKTIPYSKSTNMDIRTVLVVLLGEAKRQQLIEHNYASRDYTRPIKGVTKEKEIFDEQEAREFVKAVLTEPHPKKKAIFALLIFLGLRKAEICGLSWKDIDLDNETLSVNHNCIYFKNFGVVTKDTKSKSSKRIINIPEQLTSILLEYKTWYDNQKINHGDLWYGKDNLFLQDNGQVINPCTVNSWLKDFNIKHGFRDIPPHSLRHTCITMQINAGIPIKTVSARAGHSNERITLDVYTHALQSQDKKAAEVFNQYLMPNTN